MRSLRFRSQSGKSLKKTNVEIYWSNVMYTSLFSFSEIDRHRLWYMFHTHTLLVNQWRVFFLSIGMINGIHIRSCRTISCNNTSRRIHFNCLEETIDEQVRVKHCKMQKRRSRKKGQNRSILVDLCNGGKYKQSQRLLKMSNRQEENIMEYLDCLFDWSVECIFESSFYVHQNQYRFNDLFLTNLRKRQRLKSLFSHH